MDKIMDFRKSARPMEAPIVRKAAAEDEPFLREMLYHSLFVPEGEKPFSRTILQDPAVSKYEPKFRKPVISNTEYSGSASRTVKK